MLLLVIGLVAVIIAVVVGIFLTRRRRDDDDEPGGRQTVRDRLGSRGRDGRLRTDPRMAHKSAARGPAPSRRPAGEPRGYGGPDRGYEPAGFDQSRGYEPSPRGYGERAPRDDQRTERIPAARRGGRYQDAPEPATPVGARASRAATAPRRGAVGTDTGPGNALYDTGPSGADRTATRIADPDLADSDVFPRVRAEIPETEAKSPEAKSRPKNQAKGRGRASRGRHDDDDDDWPSTEWDKLSDEQYWAELSADKPLATTARTAQPSAPAPAPTPAKPPRAASQPPASGRAASRPQPAPDAEPEAPARRRPPADRPDRPARKGSRQGPPRRTEGADTDPGRPGLADRPAAAAATERLPARRRPAADPAAVAPAPYLPAAPEAVSARVDDDPLTSPHFARGAGGADDSRSYRTPRRNPGPQQDRSGGQAYPSAPNGYPGAAGAYPAGYPASSGGYPASSGGYPATGRDATGPVTNPGGPVRSNGSARGRDSYAGQARDSLAGGDSGDRRYTDPSGGYESYPGTPDSGRGYPASSGRHGYPAGQADRTDPGAARPDLGAPRTDPGSSRTDPGTRTSPGRRRSAPNRQAPNRQAPTRQAPASPPPSQAASNGYPASPAASAPGWGSDRSAAAEAPSAQAGLGNPYGSYVDTPPPATTPSPAPAARTAPTPPPASPYPPGQQAAGGNSYPGYTTGPTAAYSDPYAPGHGSGSGYPVNDRPPAADSRAEQGTTWYSAPPAAPPQAPAGAYPYTDPAYPAAADYPNEGSYPGAPGARDDTRYRNGHTEDPYHPDGYSGYHSRQG